VENVVENVNIMQSGSRIGFFDSGVGGLSVWREVVALLPGISTAYLADNAYCPYGLRPVEEIIERSCVLTEALLRQDCRIIVSACNTATSAAIATLRQRYNVPFVGIEPAVKPAALNTRSGVVGVLATRATLTGRLFKETSARFASHVRLVTKIGEGLVELVEAGETTSAAARAIVAANLSPLLEAGADQIVLGCTHYSFLADLIRELAGEGVEIVDAAPAVARQVARVLADLPGGDNILDQPTVAHRFGATAAADTLRMMAESFGLTPRTAPAGACGLTADCFEA